MLLVLTESVDVRRDVDVRCEHLTQACFFLLLFFEQQQKETRNCLTSCLMHSSCRIWQEPLTAGYCRTCIMAYTAPLLVMSVMRHHVCTRLAPAALTSCAILHPACLQALPLK
jgi:hypothetical protein